MKNLKRLQESVTYLISKVASLDKENTKLKRMYEVAIRDIIKLKEKMRSQNETRRSTKGRET